MAIDFDLAQSVLTAQPFSHLIGARLAAFESGTATPIRDDLLQHDGYLHGRVLFSAADNAITFAAGSVLGPAVLTSGPSVSYLRPVPPGRTLRARAAVVHAGRRQAACQCDLLAIDDEPGTLSAIAQGIVLHVQAATRRRGMTPAASDPNRDRIPREIRRPECADLGRGDAQPGRCAATRLKLRFRGSPEEALHL